MDVEGLFGRVAAVANSERWLIPIFKKKDISQGAPPVRSVESECDAVAVG
jgi:hypothetical protein